MRQSRRSVIPTELFSLDCIVRQRFQRMLRFKRECVRRGYLLEEGGVPWDLTDKEAVDELVYLIEEFERIQYGAQQKPTGKPRNSSDIEPLIPKRHSVLTGGINHAQFISDNIGKKINDFYEIERKKLGEGSFGAVSRCTNKSTHAVRAVKAIRKAHMKDVELFKQEIAILKLMDHPNIIKLYESFEGKRNIYLILELSSGGELFERINEEGHFTEKDAAILMQQMTRGTYYMHEKHVAHRDLKPENFLLASKMPIEKNMLKIIDFGVSCKFEPGQVLHTEVGTPLYMAPQVLQGRYNHMCDLWSIGVIMYEMLAGHTPFYARDTPGILTNVRLGNYSFHSSHWKHVSQDAKDLIGKLLKMKPEERYTAEKALNHEWIKNQAPKAQPVALQANLVGKFRTFRSQNKLKKAALHVIAEQFNDDQIKALRETFMALDANGDGILTAAEVRIGLKKSGLKDVPQDLQQIMDDLDNDGSGCIEYTEFLAATLDKRSYMKEDVCWAAFQIFDKDGDGQISPEDLKAAIDDGDVPSMAGALNRASIMLELDKNKDGGIDFQEFMCMMKGGGK